MLNTSEQASNRMLTPLRGESMLPNHGEGIPSFG
jgi:hypothetical protein